MGIVFSIPAVQTKLGRIATNYLNKDFQTNITVHKVDLSYLGEIEFEDIEIKDHHLDSMINIESLTTSIFSYRNIINNKFEFGEIELEGVNFIIKTYEGEENDAFNIFVERFDEEKPDTIPSGFLLTSTLVKLENADLYIIDENKPEDKPVFFNNISGHINDLLIDGPKFSGDIRAFSFVENHNIQVENLSTDFSYTREAMKLENTLLETETSTVKAQITFFRNGSFKDFNNKVKLSAEIEEAHVSLLDLNNFYDEFSKKDVLHFSASIGGTLNNFTAKNLNLKSDSNIVMRGDFNVVNGFNTENGFSVDARLSNLIAEYKQFQKLIPNVLDKSMPDGFKQVGKFEMSGNLFITPTLVNAQTQMKTGMGIAITDLELDGIDNIDQATYRGDLKIIDFKLGEFLNDSLIGKMSLDAFIDGKGFDLDNLDVIVDGKIHKHQYLDYTYENIKLDGQLQNRKFNGKLIANDDNIKFDFIGLADLASEEYKFDFEAIIDYVDFNKLNIFKHDSISVLKGDIDINLVGNSIEDIRGEMHFSQASYTNQNDLYFFNDFNITSEFNDDVRTIKLNSPDIIKGEIKGNFKFGQISGLAQNAIGSIYTNYEPLDVDLGQEVEFNFTIYDKVIEILFPEVQLASNTFVSGQMNSDDGALELMLRSPSINAYGSQIDSVRLQIDNQNPLFNTQLSIDRIASKNYRISDLQLINVTLNDTLFFRTQFKGGIENTEDFNLGFYHTIDSLNNSVIGINQSEIKYKNQIWELNPNENKKNKVVFENDYSAFDVQQFDMISGRQRVSLYGSTFGADEKNINLEFENVALAGITPDIEEWNFAGMLNGTLQYNEEQGDVIPKVNLTVEDFFVNESYQGNLNIEMLGKNSVKEFDVKATINENGFYSLFAEGNIDLTSEEPTINMDIDFERLKLDILSPIGDENFTNMRGFVYGDVQLSGLLENPDMVGDLFLDEAGVALPYLNVDYDFLGTTVIELNNQTFDIVDLTLRDVVEDTYGILTGTISHKNFADWRLDLNLDTDNLLVLNTQESEEELYYGKGFMAGNATISGFADDLTINVNGKTNPGTNFIIPMSDLKDTNSSKLVTFVEEGDEEETEFLLPNEVLLERFKGLSINFNLEVTKDALIELIMDKATGSSLKGSGTGDLQIEIDTNGKFNMFGDMSVEQGSYDFKWGGIINKRFVATKGGTISWNGNPYTADLDIETTLRVFANPKTILETLSTNRDIPVDLVARFTGELYESQQEYDIVVPDIDSDVKAELDFKINQGDDKLSHFFSLLIFGNFYNDNSSLFENGKGVGEETAYQLLSSAVTGLINSGNDNFNLRFDYRPADDRPEAENLKTDDQVDISVATKINDRILVDGKIGVPVGSNNDATVIGEAKIEFLLNDEGTLRSTVFNRQNEIQYTDEEEGYTQGVGLSYSFDFDTGSELLQKLGLKKKEEKSDSILIESDTIPVQTKNLVNFNSDN